MDNNRPTNPPSLWLIYIISKINTFEYKAKGYTQKIFDREFYA